jgi:hypothetical protein
MADQPSEISSFSLQAAKAFSEKYANTTNEKQYSQSFWTDLFTKVIGVPDLLAAGIEFEYPVISAEGKTNWIDVFWSGVLLIEQKSTGKNLDLAETQARGYLVGLPPEHRPPAIILSDFSKFRIIDVLMNEQIEFPLSELSENLHRLELILGKQIASATRQEVSADIHAVELMGNLFNTFDKAGYEGHALSVFLVRVLFLNFGDDTRMWKRIGNGLFSDYIANSAPDGSGLGAQIQELFQVLNTPNEKRPTTTGDNLTNFPYINGGVFEETLPIFSFNSEMRKALIETTQYDWSKISPAIFGAMFQTVKSKEDRRSLGEHYTSEANILKVIRPLFLDDYLEKLTKSWDSPQSLKKLRKELAENNYLDPACGSGNFLVVAYRRLRDLELKIVARLNELEGKEGQNLLEGTWGLSVHLNQFHGIEINEWSSQIATVAMFIADHQANISMEELTGFAPERFPLRESAKVVHANALQVDWKTVCPATDSTFVMGNPPFLGVRLRTPEQKEDQARIWNNSKGSGVIDFVANWFVLASRYIEGTKARVGLVSTNSITQGDQASTLWTELEKQSVEIIFAHRSFAWTNESKGKAAVHCVIVGLSNENNSKKKPLWIYEDPKGEPEIHQASNINGYLLDAPNIVVSAKRKPIAKLMPPMLAGNEPRDGGYLSNISASEAESIRESDPVAAKYLKPLIGSDELLNGANSRFCLWLVDASPTEIKESPILKSKVQEVYNERKDAKGHKGAAANKPALFKAITQPKSSFIGVPSVSSEKRNYIPINFLEPDQIISNAMFAIPTNERWVFGLIENKVFTAWVRVVSSRLESRYQISSTAVYNTMPFPELSKEQSEKVSQLAEKVLEVREKFSENSLGDLYDPLLMPIELVKAQESLDKYILQIYGLKQNATDEEILAELFRRYQELTDDKLI